MNNKLISWLSSYKFLPKFMRDFDSQRDLIRVIDHVYEGNPGDEIMPNVMSAQCYVIDRFLWFMASRGYTLQKTKTKLDFEPETFSVREWEKNLIMTEIFKITKQSKNGMAAGKKLYESRKYYDAGIKQLKRILDRVGGRIVGYQYIVDDWVKIYEYKTDNYDDTIDMQKKLKQLNL